MHLKGNMGLIQPLANRNVSAAKKVETLAAAKQSAAVQTCRRCALAFKGGHLKFLSFVSNAGRTSDIGLVWGFFSLAISEPTGVRKVSGRYMLTPDANLSVYLFCSNPTAR